MELDGDIACSVETWCRLVGNFTSQQRSKFMESNMRSMLQIPPIRMQVVLLQYMFHIYDHESSTFVLPNKGKFALTAQDAECIYGLRNYGLSANRIIDEEGEDGKSRIPPHFLSATTGNIVIEDLIADIVMSKAADDDFLRKSVLVLLGTVLAPMTKRIVPKDYWVLVEDIDRMSTINWSEFTVDHLMVYFRLVTRYKQIRQWPKGNLSLIQVLNMFSTLFLIW